METVLSLVTKINDLLWNSVLLVLLCGTGIYFTIRLKFIQVRKLGEGMKLVFGNIHLKDYKKKEGEMSPFQALATAIAAQVGTGNLTGAATALIGGGPGAIFWMWLSAFFGMATIYSEATLAQKFKTTVEGEVTGGPVYYIQAAFKGTFGKILSKAFAIFIILALGFMGNMVQSNSIGSAFKEVFANRNIEIPPMMIGICVAVVAGIIFIGGTDRLASVVEKFVPCMAAIYICGSLIVIFMHASAIPTAFKMIFVCAFQPKAMLGAGAGITVRSAIRYGVARGLFSNEAGMGSTPHAHARACAENPHKQGLVAMVSVFIDTFVVLNLTVFSILTTGALESGKDGTALAQVAFMSSFKNFGDIFVAICLLFFAFSTILGWHFFGKINVEYLFGKKASRIYSIIVLLFIIVGSTLKVNFVWTLSDFFNGLMVIPNVLALLVLSGVVTKIYKTYNRKKDDNSY